MNEVFLGTDDKMFLRQKHEFSEVEKIKFERKEDMATWEFIAEVLRRGPRFQVIQI